MDTITERKIQEMKLVTDIVKSEFKKRKQKTEDVNPKSEDIL